MGKTLYLSGPMTGYEQFNYPAFHANAAFLRDNGWTVISPAELDAEIGVDANTEMTEERYLEVIKHDYAALLESDAIAFMPGWEKSRGAALESRFANVLKLERYRVDATKDYFERETLIGICGYAQAGKDTLAGLLVEQYGFSRRGYADALRGILYSLNPNINVPYALNGGERVPSQLEGLNRLQAVVDYYGWEKAKKIDEVRQLLQRLGTEGGREWLGENVWVEGLFNKPNPVRLVIPDVRFPNEVQSIKERGGVVVRVERDGCGPVNGHISETAAVGLQDITLHNETGDPGSMLDQLHGILPFYGIELQKVV